MGGKNTLQFLIWVATLFFVAMMFVPLLLEMVVRLGQSGMP
ncbi:MAG TPA: hypothetical protein VIE37_20265 [Methylomirabilota bacterium]|jgi:hypothetical protein